MGLLLMSESLPIFPNPMPASGILSPRVWALIPCAGSGSRAGTAQPKQYQSVAGQPLVMHTLRAFADVFSLDHTLVVVAAEDGFFDEQVQNEAVWSVAKAGGATRAATVMNGLKHLQNRGAQAQDWVLVHDAARCLVTPAQIQSLIEVCQADEVGGLLAHKLPDTLKSEMQGRVGSTIDRSDKWLAQTPQMFRIGALIAAMQFAGDKVTDESSAMEAMGLSPQLVAGGAQNFKVTYPEDFALAEAILLGRQRGTRPAPDSRTPNYDYP